MSKNNFSNDSSKIKLKSNLPDKPDNINPNYPQPPVSSQNAQN
jgi:hypothetical protein